MKKIEIHSLSRSGHHPIIFWIIHNISGIKFRDGDNKIDHIFRKDQNKYYDEKKNLYYFNHVNKSNDVFPERYKYLIKNFENFKYEHTTDSVIVHRDFLNLLASRLKIWEERTINFLDNPIDCNFYWKNTLEIWKIHAKNILNHNNGILYNKWISDRNYRDQVSNKIGIVNSVDNIDYVPKHANGSSFIGRVKENDTNNYLNRYLMVDFPYEIIDYISKDNELIDFNYNLYDIDILEQINKIKCL
jgi:hypothetical protein